MRNPERTIENISFLDFSAESSKAKKNINSDKTFFFSKNCMTTSLTQTQLSFLSINMQEQYNLGIHYCAPDCRFCR